MSSPLISVVIPAHDAETHLAETLASALAQRGRFELEVIVVDDGSRDATCALAESFPGVRLIRQANAGPSAARNRGIAAARGGLVAFLDADDLWTPDKLAVQLAVLDAHPRAALVFGDCRLFWDDGEAARTMLEEYRLTPAGGGETAQIDDPYPSLLTCNYVATSSALVRKDALLATGGFDESMRLVEDLDLWLRLALHHPFAYTTRLCEHKRQHPSGVSNAEEPMALAYIALLRRQRKSCAETLDRHDIRVEPLIAAEYNLLGDRRERAGDAPGARRFYRLALAEGLALRPLYYLARSWLPTRHRAQQHRPEPS